jgi:hypothetical protein
VKAVDKFRKESKAATTRAYPYPMLFRQVTQPKNDYIVVSAHSSENRDFIPLGFLSKSHIVGNSCFSVPNATKYHFGVMMSRMHMAWVKYTCGRLESRYRYSKDIVYNNFPWPSPTEKQVEAIETAAKEVLDARGEFSSSTLAELYDPLGMPGALAKAHQRLDRAVDAAYGKAGLKTDAERVAFLFEKYHAMAAPLDIQEPEKPKRARKTKASA